MNTETIKGRLHEYIEHADSKHLEAIYLLLEKDLPLSVQYDKATLDSLYQRRDNHLKGLSVSYTEEEAFQYIRDHKKRD